MFIFKHINFSKIFIAFITICYIINVVTNYYFVDILALQPKLLLDNLAIWKLFTYPLAINSLDSFVLFFFAFALSSTKLEKIIGSIRYASWLTILSIIYGSIITLSFINSTAAITGLDALSFFVITLHILLKPRTFINPFKARINIVTITLIFFILYISTKILIYGLSDITSANFLTSISFGIFTALLIYFQIKLYKSFNSKSFGYDNLSNIPNIEFLATIKDNKSSNFLYNTEKLRFNSFNENVEEIEQNMILTEDPVSNEEKLNYILDKMNEKGKDSLTVAEKKFLYFYSMNI